MLMLFVLELKAPLVASIGCAAAIVITIIRVSNTKLALVRGLVGGMSAESHLKHASIVAHCLLACLGLQETATATSAELHLVAIVTTASCNTN